MKSELKECVDCGAGFWGYNQNECPPCWEKRLVRKTDTDHCPKCGEYLHDEMGHMCPWPEPTQGLDTPS